MYSKEQIRVHGEIMTKWIENPEIKLELRMKDESNWRPYDSIKMPIFSLDFEYRVKPEPKILYVNELDEVFTEEDLEDEVFWYSEKYDKILKDKLKEIITYEKKPSFCGCFITGIAKSEVSAYKLAIKMYRGEV